ncbi:MAG TPA: hypothetical protein VJQ58_04300 [Burkholderiales bacterium]|nr:hypothetical protein [Burkholderiales bacterium]
MRALAFVVLFILGGTASAQLRTVPPEAKRGTLSHVQDMLIEVDGKPGRLSPGAQIRDTANRLVLPVALPPKSDTKYLLDEAGNVHRVWILSAQESAQADKEAPPKPKPPVKKDNGKAKSKDEKK